MAKVTGTQATLVGGTNGTVAELTDISWSGWGRPAIDNTSNDDTGRVFIPGTKVDPGELSLQFMLDETQQADFLTFEAAEEVWTLTSNTNETFICSGFLTLTEYNWPHEGAITGSATIKLSGPVTGTAVTA